MKKLSLLIMVIALGAAKAQEMQISKITFPTDEFASTIVGMTQDSQGYLWLASITQGLCRYDGENLKQFVNERDNPNSLITNRLECLATGHDGAIWIGTFSQGLIRFDPVTESFTNYLHDPDNPNSIRSGSIRAITPNKNDGLWIGTLEGIDYFDLQTNTFHHDFSKSPDAQMLQKEHIRTLYLDKSGILWAGASSPFYGEETQGGLFRIDTQTKEVKRYFHTSENNSLINDYVNAIFEDSQGNFWVGTAGDGLHTMDRNKGTFTRHTYDPTNPDKLSRPPVRDFSYAADHIRFITEDSEGSIWIGTLGNGLNRYDPKEKTIRHFGTSEPGIYHLGTDYYWSCLKTADNLLWLGAWEWTAKDQILTRINLTPQQVNHQLLNNIVSSFEEGGEGAIYIGANNVLYQIDDDGRQQTLFQITNPALGDIYHMSKDKKENLWISSASGLHYYNIKTDSLTSYALSENETFSKISNIFHVTAFINEDSLLVGSEDGLYLFDIIRKKFTYILQSIERDKVQAFKRVMDIFIDSRKNIWVAYRSLGLKRLDLATGNYKDYTPNKVRTMIYDFFEDASGNLYAGGASCGLQKYDPAIDDFTLVEDKTGLLNSNTEIFGITQADDSTFWLNTGMGLVKYDVTSNSSLLYGDSWGLSSSRILSFQIFNSSKGDIYLSTSSGYLKFRPEDFERKSDYEPQPFISKFSTGEQDDLLRKDSIAGNIRLGYDENNISLTLGYVNFLTSGSDKKLQYRLEPYDDEWRRGRNEEEVIYYKLMPGDYMFRIRALDIYGEWVETSLSFSIGPPWWRTWWAYVLYILTLGFIVWKVHLFQKERVIKAEKEKNRERELAQAKEIEQAYTILKATQSQLIQAEKMASLGELTAGIAHEIQNPLNFVNNFSDVNIELAEELEEEINKGDLEEARAILQDLKSNEEKINHHGKRADAIVKGMLQHSRTSTGQKEPTDINALCDEYLRLSYHGLRAKDSSFNAEFSTEFDPNLPKVNVIPQDIGRVLLNLINNAFYAVNEKSQKSKEDYQPLVKILTKRTSPFQGGSEGVEITVTDNGHGIPDAIKEKIFQPFFTTKPTGHGTGLGLSLSYDIVIAHGGTLEVESNEGEGTAFKITLKAQ